MREIPVTTHGTILKVLGPTLAEISLPNGKITLGHLSRELESRGAAPSNGAGVRLELTPFDFDKARIVEFHPALENEAARPIHRRKNP